MKKIFVVPFHALDGRVDDVKTRATELGNGIGDALDGLTAGLGVADDASFADVVTASFELGLDEDDGGSLPGLVRLTKSAQNRGQNEGCRDEGDIHSKECGRGLSGEEQLGGGELACIGSLTEGYARVVAELLGDLPVTGIDR